MPKYKPSVDINESLKKLAVSELKALIYLLDNGRYDSLLREDLIKSVNAELKSKIADLENAFGTGKENVEFVATEVMNKTKDLKSAIDRSLNSKVEKSAQDLEYYLTLWADVINGDTVYDKSAFKENVKYNKAQRRFTAKLSELENVCEKFTQSEKRLEGNIQEQEANLNDLNSNIKQTTNQRMIEQLFNQINAVKGKIEMLTTRRNNYSACVNMLDIIYSNALEMFNDLEFSNHNYGKLKVILDMRRLKNILAEPDKVIVELKLIEKELKSIHVNTKSVNANIKSFNIGATEVSGDAMKYREELLKEESNKALLEDVNELGNTTNVKENENGIL